MPPAIPDRWLDYKPVGEIIKGTRFIAFKVPLREHVVRSVKHHTRLSCESLLEKIPNLGMIIDLTNTYRYYDPIFFQEKGVVHEKLMIPGRDVPPKNLADKFIMLVNNFLQENANNDKLIGVHCTHGVNRTGYLIARYMISEMNISPQEAIKNFEEAREHCIERDNYRNDLCWKASSGTSNGSHHHYDNSRGYYDNTTSQNTSHRYENRPRNSRQNYNNRTQTSSHNQTDVENWRAPRTNKNNITPLDSGSGGNRYHNSTNGFRQRNFYNTDERQYSQRGNSNYRNGRTNSYARNDRQYSQHRHFYERDDNVDGYDN